MAQSVDGLTQALNTFNKVVDLVIKEPRGPKRWRTAHDLLWLNVSHKNKRIYREVCAENKLVRDAVDKTGFDIKATRKDRADKTMREAMNIPTGAYMAIAKADPDAFKEKANAKKMFETFPEYRTRELF